MQGFGKGIKRKTGTQEREADLRIHTEAAKYGLIIQFGSWERVLWYRLEK